MKGPGFKNALIDEISQAIEQRLGDNIELQVVTVESIPRDNSGKFQIFKSKIDADHS